MWSSGGSGSAPEDIAHLLRWSRAQRISIRRDELMFFDDEDMFTYTSRRTRPRYKSELRRGHRDADER